ncbi:hypothetical protein RhiirB3_448679, partial [Rhizophagus irregularis]
FSAQLESHKQRIVELENTVFPNDASYSTYESYDAFQENQDSHRESHEEMYNWNDADRTSAPKQQSSTLNMIMHISPETSFSHDGPANVLSSRHIPFSTSAVLQPKYAPHHSQPIDFNKELDSITSTQQIIHSQLDFILTKLDGLSPSQE